MFTLPCLFLPISNTLMVSFDENSLARTLVSLFLLLFRAKEETTRARIRTFPPNVFQKIHLTAFGCDWLICALSMYLEGIGGLLEGIFILNIAKYIFMT